MKPPPPRCPNCQYEIRTYSEAVEALEAGARCLTCSAGLDQAALEAWLDAWTDEEVLAEGAERAAAEVDLDEEEALFDGIPDFGDEGEEEEDPLF